MTPARPKVSPKPGKGMTPKKSLATEKAMVKKKDAAANRKGSYVDNSELSKYLGSPAPTPPSESASDKKARRWADFSAANKAQGQSKEQRAPYVPAMKKGGMCKTKKYARGGGIEVRGKTKGKMI